MSLQDAICGTSIADFKKACRARVFNDRWNRWLLVRSGEDAPSTRELFDDSAKALKTWLSGEDGRPHFTNLSVSVADPNDLPTTLPPVLQSRSTECGGRVTIEPTEPRLGVLATFVARGAVTDIPWPVLNRRALAGEDCPLGVTWLLEKSFEPDDVNVPVEERDEPFDRLKEGAAGAAKGAGEAAPAVERIVKLVVIGMGLYAVAEVAKAFR